MTDASLTNAGNAERQGPPSSSDATDLPGHGATTTAGPNGVLRWWPASVGLAIGVLGLLGIEPWEPSEPTTPLLPGLAVAYLVLGAVRGQLRRPGVLALQVIGLVIFATCAVLAAIVDPAAGHHIVGAGFLAHAAWDVAHHRDLSRLHAVGVVPRGWAEFCIVLDLLIGASLIAVPFA